MDSRYYCSHIRLFAEIVGVKEGNGMIEELKPCPFCGGKAKIIGGPEDWSPSFYDPDSGGDPIAVICENCGCGLHRNYDDYSDARKAWNARV